MSLYGYGAHGLCNTALKGGRGVTVHMSQSSQYRGYAPMGRFTPGLKAGALQTRFGSD